MINYSIAIMSSKPGTRKADIQETKAYGMAQASEVLDINKFAEHIAAHGSRADRGACHSRCHRFEKSRGIL